MGIIKENGGALYQWDTDRTVEITPWQNYKVDEVHFENRNCETALVVDPKIVDGKLVADIPNILLQTAINIRVLAYMHTDGGGRTVADYTMGVNARQRPSDYVYTETEVKTYTALEKRVKALEDGETGGTVDDERIANAVESYLAENPVEGTPGKDGQDGADGLSAYQIWLNAGNSGTEDDFLASLKGADGQDGADGQPGKDGTNGANGVDGVSCTHSWNGTVLTVTSASGTYSSDLKGEKGDPYTLTNEDKTEMVNAVLAALPVAEGVGF